MMVDKAVSTSDNNHDTLKYEEVFSSLIENKILAIKRDCEEKSRLKRSKSFRRIIFGKKLFCACNSKKSSIGSAADIEKGKAKLESHSSDEKSVKRNVDEPIIVQNENTISILRTENEKFCGEKSLSPKSSESEKNIDCSIVSPDSSPDLVHKSDDSNNGSTSENGIKNLIVKVLTHQNDDVLRTKEFTDKDSITHPSTTSIGSINLDITTTQADDSITSIKDSIESLPYPLDDNDGDIIYDNKDLLRNHILEARSISAQCSPILPRPERYNTYIKSQVSYMDNYYNNAERQINFLSRQNTSEDSANLTISTLLLNNNSNRDFDDTKYNFNNNKKSKSTSILVISNSDNVNTNVINRLDSNFNFNTYLNDNLRDVIKRKQSLETASAIINNYKTVPKPIIPKSTTLSENVSKLQRMVSTSTASSPVPSGCCASSKSKEKQMRTKLVRSSEHCSSDDEYRKRKRKYKRHHRCSDPVLVYPTSGGLQHCILAMPPNQPIEIHYNEGYKYDMQLDLEHDKTCDLDNILPTHRTHKHRHHKHKKKHKHKKPKILVHDLDTQCVKVIDPDDLPQRARWTIIATAFLLLLMCLMLVGITLRMAPIIDDMGI